MTPPAPPTLTVRHEGSERTFAAGHDVVVGRDLRADMRITHPLISRAHLLLRFDQGRWLAIDNGSLNGTFVNGRRVPVVDIRDGQTVNIGNPGRAAADLRGRAAPRDGRAATANRVDARRHGRPVAGSAVRPAGRPGPPGPTASAAPPGPPPGPPELATAAHPAAAGPAAARRRSNPCTRPLPSDGRPRIRSRSAAAATPHAMSDSAPATQMCRPSGRQAA